MSQPLNRINYFPASWYRKADCRSLPMSTISRAIELPEDDRFSTEPDVLYEQAARVGTLRIVVRDSDADRAGLSKDEDFLWLHYFARDTESAGKVDGCEIVAYRCDANGRVLDWSTRYTIHARNLNIAIEKLSLQIVNGLIEPTHIENEAGGKWTINFEARFHEASE